MEIKLLIKMSDSVINGLNQKDCKEIIQEIILGLIDANSEKNYTQIDKLAELLVKITQRQKNA